MSCAASTRSHRGPVIAGTAVASVLVVGVIAVALSRRSAAPSNAPDGVSAQPAPASPRVPALPVDVLPDATIQAVEPVTPDAATASTNEDSARKVAECVEMRSQRHWENLANCASALEALGLVDKAHELQRTASQEMANEAQAGEIEQAVLAGKLKDAQVRLRSLDATSVYYATALAALTKAEDAAIETAVQQVQHAADVHDCGSASRRARQLAATSTERVVAAVTAVKCVDKQADAKTTTDRPPPQPAAATSAVDCNTINVDDIMRQAANQYGAGHAKAAVALVAKAVACRPDAQAYRFGAMYACSAHDVATAKAYFKKLPSNMQSLAAKWCQSTGIDLRGSGVIR
jgi:hypothetical protein